MNMPLRRAVWASMTLALAIVAFGCGTPPRPFPSIEAPIERSKSNHVYDEIAKAIEDGEFEAIVDFYEGDFDLGGATLKLSAGMQGHITGEVRAGLILRASLVMSSPAIVEIEKQHVVLSFTSAHFDQYGRTEVGNLRIVEPPLYKLVEPAILPKARALIEKSVSLNVYAEEVLRGSVFSRNNAEPVPPPVVSSEDPQRVSAVYLTEAPAPDATTSGAPADEARGTRDRSMQDAIAGVTLRVNRATIAPGARFQFANHDKHPDFGGQSRVFVGERSSVSLPYVRIDFDPRSNDVACVKVARASMYLNTIESTLVTAGQTFKLGKNSSLLLRGLDVTAERRAGSGDWNWSFQTQGGVADVALAQGDLGIKGMWLRVGKGSSMSLREVRFSGRDKELLRLDGQGALRLVVESGIAFLGPMILSVGQGSILDVEGVIRSDVVAAGSPTGVEVEGEISLLDLKIDDVLINDEVNAFLASTQTDRSALNIFPLGALDKPRVAYVRAGRGSRVVARNVAFSSGDSWNVNGAVALCDLRAVEGRLQLGSESWIEFGEDSRVMLTEVRLDRARRSAAGRIGGTLNVNGGVLSLGGDNFATRFPLAAPSRVTIDAGKVAFSSEHGGSATGVLAEVTAATPPVQSGRHAVVMLGRPTRVSSVKELAANEPTQFTLAGGAVIGVSDLEFDARGPSSAWVNLDASVTEALIRIDGDNGIVSVRPFTARSVEPLRYERGAEAPLSGRFDASGVEVSVGIIAPGGSTQMTRIRGRFESASLSFPRHGTAHGRLTNGTFSFADGEWAIGPATVRLKAGTADNAEVTWTGPGERQATLTAKLLEAGLELDAVSRRQVADGVFITTEPVFSRLRLRDVDARFSSSRALESLEIDDCALVPDTDASVYIEVDTEESSAFYETVDDNGNALSDPKSLFGYKHHGTMGVRVWLLDKSPVGGPLAWSSGRFQKVPHIPERTVRIAFDSRNDHYDTGNKNASRVTVSGRTVKVDGNTKDKVDGQRERATRRIIISSGNKNHTDYRVFVWNTAGARHGVDPPAARPAKRPNPPGDLRIRLNATLEIRERGIFLVIRDFEWPRLEDDLHYDLWTDTDDLVEVFGGIGNVVTNIFTLGQAAWDPVGKGLRAGRREADMKLNKGFGTMVQAIMDDFDKRPLVPAK